VKIKISGSTLFANGDPASEVEVRLFDRDAEGKQDDDLTVSPGLSDENGRFRLTYEPLRYLDFHHLRTEGTPGEPFNSGHEESGIRLPDMTDIYLPYLRFTYQFNGTLRQHSSGLGIFKSKFYLPENPPVDILASEHGFKFTNSFPAYFLPFSTPTYVGTSKVGSVYGLCGGMCSAAYDFALARLPIPDIREIPKAGSRLSLSFRRQMDSLGGFGQQVVRVAQWTSTPTDTVLGTRAQSLHEFNLMRSSLDDKNPVILALIYEHATTLKKLSRVIFNNHQVLAHSYEQDASGVITLHVYDPNLPGRDDVVIRSEPVELGQVDTPSGIQTVRVKLRPTRGRLFIPASTRFLPHRPMSRMPYKKLIQL
jgi:hypothetical protein